MKKMKEISQIVKTEGFKVNLNLRLLQQWGKFLEKKHNSKTGEKLIIMKCINLCNSKELDEPAKKSGSMRKRRSI